MCGKKGLGQCKGHASTFDAQGQKEGYGYTIELQYYIFCEGPLALSPFTHSLTCDYVESSSNMRTRL